MSLKYLLVIYAVILSIIYLGVFLSNFADASIRTEWASMLMDSFNVVLGALLGLLSAIAAQGSEK